MNNLIRNTIAIDANVFVHMFMHMIDPDNNPYEHIRALLYRLRKAKFGILLDESRMIAREYRKHVFPCFLKTDDDDTKRLLRYWFRQENQKIVPINLNDNLMRAIKSIVGPSKGADRFYVYVALKEGRILVTNDRRDIWSNRDRLLKIKTRPRLPKGADILNSKRAHYKLTRDKL